MANLLKSFRTGETDLKPKFDWYQATVPAFQPALLHGLRPHLPEPLLEIPGKGMNSYAHRLDLCHASEVFWTVLWGGTNPHPHVKAGGDHAPGLADALRSTFPDHRVSRVDVAVDYRGNTAFDDTVLLMSEIGRQHRLKGSKIVPDDPDDGSTYYLGGKQSAVQLRCYEKGKELYKKTGDPVWKNLFDQVRIELQVRPQKKFKSTAALMEPEAFWGCSRWTAEIASGVLSMNVEPVRMKPTPIADHDRAMNYLIQHYGRTMLRQRDRLGSQEAFCADLKARLDLYAETLSD